MLLHLHIAGGAIIPARDKVTYEPLAPPTSHFGPALADLLTKACNLMSLTLEKFETLLIYEPQLSDIIPRCPSLSTISFTRMRSRARNVVLRLNNLRRIDLDTKEELFSLMQHSQTSLTTITTTRSLRKPPSEAGQWPNVHTLNIRDTIPVDVGAFVWAFPNLRNVRLTPTKVYTLVRRRVRDPRQVFWPLLHYVEGSVFDLYAIGLSSQIYHLKLASLPFKFSGPDAFSLAYGEAILDLIRRSKPMALSFHACSPTNVAPFDAAFYSQLCRLTPQLNFVGLALTENVLGRLRLATTYLAPLPIVYFLITFPYKRATKALVEMADLEFGPLLLNIPTLRVVEVEVRPSTQFPYACFGSRRWWRVDLNPEINARTLRPLSEMEGRRVGRRWKR